MRKTKLECWGEPVGFFTSHTHGEHRHPFLAAFGVGAIVVLIALLAVV